MYMILYIYMRTENASSRDSHETNSISFLVAATNSANNVADVVLRNKGNQLSYKIGFLATNCLIKMVS